MKQKSFLAPTPDGREIRSIRAPLSGGETLESVGPAKDVV